MKNWKITNTSPNKQPIKVSMILSNTVSKGIILRHGEFVLAKPQMTSSLDMQEKRKFVTIDKNFDNSETKLSEGLAYNEEFLTINKPSKMEEAEKNALEYIKKSE